MIRKLFIYFGLILIITALSLSTLFYLHFIKLARPFSAAESNPRGTILLVPLDSRPPCTDYVVKLARMAGFQVILPPANLLDNYQRPADSAGLLNWLKQNISRSDSAILSMDMLIHGGLWASRNNSTPPETIDAVLDLLSEMHAAYPQVKLFAFNIIPRLLIADNLQMQMFSRPMAEWSILQETTLLFENPDDFKRLHELESLIPPDLTSQYRMLFAKNHALARRLVGLTKNGTLSGLVLGQDDSAPFGLGNMLRKKLELEFSTIPDLNKKLFITRGTDEVALSLLGQLSRNMHERNRKVYVHYTESDAANLILPYMPGTLSRVVNEKLALSAAEITTELSGADYILVIHAGNALSSSQLIAKEAEQIKTWIMTNRQVAIVDLAVDWIDKQTLLPYLIRNDTPLHKLTAYAGWNTASNSVGTAVTQAGLVIQGRNSKDPATAIHRDIARLEFISERILDDWYYQKFFRHQLNDTLIKHKIDPYHLLQARERVSTMLSRQIGNAHIQYIRRFWRNAIFLLPPSETDAYAVYQTEVQSSLPWDRTFEISVNVKIYPALIIP